jgi:lysylphosphatidylglycerol synthetase-like protein (DUF2156 family)
MNEQNFNKSWLVAIIPGILVIVVAVFVVVLLLIKLVWAWTIPDIFPGAVAAGLIVKTISWYTAFKLAVFASIMAGVAGARHEHMNQKIRRQG